MPFSLPFHLSQDDSRIANPPEKAQQDHPIAMLMLGFTNVTKVNKSPNRVIAASVVVINPSFAGL